MQLKLLPYGLAVLFSVLVICEPAFSGNIISSDKMLHQITIFMCGDVMTGRGIDQVLPSLLSMSRS